MTRKNRLLLSYASRHSVIRTSLSTSAVVGTILNLINQFPNLLNHTPLSPLRIGLNYLTPYLVATIGAVRMCLHYEGGGKDQASVFRTGETNRDRS